MSHVYLHAFSRALAIASMVVAGCAGTPPVKTFSEGQSVAFGMVEVIHDDKAGDAGSFSVVLLRPGQDKADHIILAKTGEFYWDVGPGEYTLVSFQFVTRGGERNLHLGAKFTIPEEPTTVYIGELIVRLDGYRHAVGIADRYEEGATRLAAGYPDHPLAMARNLMSLEPPIGNFTAIRSACAPEWGIACEGRQYGVKPLSPAHSSGNYTLVNSLTPTFEWSASSRPDVRYDLVIRKSLSCRGVITFREGLLGDVVVYRENLTDSKYVLDMPLEPGTNYIWSIRLRDEDVVSVWSSTGRFNFFIIGFSSRSGEQFRFSTLKGGA